MSPARDRLTALTNPRSVALIGVSSDAERVTARPLSYLLKHGFEGQVYPVNPSSKRLQGVETLASINDAPEAVDHAYILLDRNRAVTAFEDCVNAGVQCISILADGFAESGVEGASLQRVLSERAKETGTLLLGPNSMGIADTRTRFVCTTNAAFAADELISGRFAVVSQSGSLIGAILSRGAAVGIGFSTLVSVGNEAHDDVASIGRLLLNDPDTDAVLLALETIRDADAFVAFAQEAHKCGKPIVAYIYAMSKEGKALSTSHTGALVGSARALQALMKDCGVHVVDVFEALFEAPGAIRAIDSRIGNRPKTVTVVSTTGGGGAMVVDRLSLRGIAMTPCPEGARRRLHALDISVPATRLVDVTLAGTHYETMRRVVDEIASDPETGVVVTAIGSSAQFQPQLAVKPVVDVASRNNTCAPILAFAVPEATNALREFNACGIPAFRTLESCIDTIASAFSIRDPVAPAAPKISAATGAAVADLGPGVHSEEVAYGVFETLGIPACQRSLLALGQEHPDALPFPFPVAAKLVSPSLPHKTEAGAVRLGIRGHCELCDAIQTFENLVDARGIADDVEGILIQPMLNGLAEVLIGLNRDPVVGAMITVGMGGRLAEIYDDVSVRRAPVTLETASEMLEEVCGFAILRGYRNLPVGDTRALADTVATFSALAVIPRVQEAEINPLLVHEEGAGVTMLDALLVLSDEERSSTK